MRSGGGVLLVATLQLLAGFSLLGVYEAYKTHYFNSNIAAGSEGLSGDIAKQLVAERALYFRTPLDYLFWFSTASSICALFGLAGIFSSQPALVTIFFGYNLVQQIVAFSLFVDVLADQKIRYVGEAATVTPYEQAAAGLLFITADLSLASVYFTARAVAELRQKQREVRYQEMGVVGDVLQFEPDV